MPRWIFCDDTKLELLERNLKIGRVWRVIRLGRIMPGFWRSLAWGPSSRTRKKTLCCQKDVKENEPGSFSVSWPVPFLSRGSASEMTEKIGEETGSSRSRNTSRLNGSSSSRLICLCRWSRITSCIQPFLTLRTSFSPPSKNILMAYVNGPSKG